MTERAAHTPLVHRPARIHRRGKTGWIGQKIVTMLRAKGADVVVAETRLEHIQDVRNACHVLTGPTP